MSYGDFAAQIVGRGGSEPTRDRETKVSTFVYKEKTWTCTDASRAAMTESLADGYEMEYCLAEHCKLKSE